MNSGLASAIALIAVACSPQAPGGTVGRAALESLAARLAASDIHSIQLCHVPAGVESPNRRTPDVLDAGCFTTVNVAYPQVRRTRATLVAVMHETSMAAIDDGGDLRWRVSFIDAQGATAAAFYFSGDGSSGVYEGRAVTYRGPLFRWVVSAIPEPFR